VPIPSFRFALTLLATAGILASPLAAQAQGRPDLVAQSLRDASMTYAPGEMLVQFRDGVDEARKLVALAPLQGRLAQLLRSRLQRNDGRGDLHRIQFDSRVDMAAAVQALQADAAVDFAEPNWIHQHQAVPDDTLFTNGSLWGMYGAASNPSNLYGSGAAQAWAQDKTCGSEVVVGVIDEGAMFFHEDLRGQFWTNPHDPRDGIDNDGNGHVDDLHGWDFVGDDKSVYDGTGDDHGTHVSGTIGATGGNATGVVGMCWNITLISAKFLGATGGTTANAVLAIDYLTDLKTRHGLNLVATSNSWGGGGFSAALKDAIDRAGAADILFVAAAGNNGRNNDLTPHYPSSFNSENIISVAAITKNGTRASFSNYGATSVDLGAPGDGIWSTVPGRRRFQSSYASYSGTSMATPHVSGAVALYKSLNPAATGAQIKAAIMAAALPTPSMAGVTVTGGRLDVSGF